MKTKRVSLQEYDALIKENEEQKAEIARLHLQIKWLIEQVRISMRTQLGEPCENSVYEDGGAFNEAEATAVEHAAEPELSDIIMRYRKRQRMPGDSLPRNLPVEVTEAHLPEAEQACPKCGHPMDITGREVRRELKLTGEGASVTEHMRNVYACRFCRNGHSAPVHNVPADEPLIKGSVASPEAVAHIMTAKFAMGVSLYAQAQEWKRRGLELGRQTLANWLVTCAEDWLEPVYAALRRVMLERHSALHADVTRLQVLREERRRVRNNRCIWLYRTAGFDRDGHATKMPIVLFAYQHDKKAARPEAFLSGYKGYLHAGASEDFYGLHEDITVVGCWADVRRRLDEALAGTLPREREASSAFIAKRYCDSLLEIEGPIADCAPDARHRERQQKAVSILNEFHAWLRSHHAQKNRMGRIAQHVLSKWQYLERYMLDGQLEISNSRAELGIKPFATGQAGFLFDNTPKGAQAGAITYSIIETAKENGLDPLAYLTYIFKNAPNWNIRNEPDKLRLLLPDAAPDDCRVKPKDSRQN